jgi:hypothetical protein
VLKIATNKEKQKNLQKGEPRPKVLMDLDHPNASEALD